MSHLRRHASPTLAAGKRAVDRDDDTAAPSPAGPAPLPTLVVGAATDPAEAAADRMAENALARVGPAPDEHRHGPGCDHLRRRATPPTAAATIGAAGGALDTGAHATIQARRGGGDQLPGPVLDRMNVAYGRDFSAVRIHTDGKAAELAGGMSAAAFTTGTDVFFGAGQFRPGTPDGDHMIAHELAHVVQDGGGSGPVVQRNFLDRIGKAVGLVEKTDDEKAEEARITQEKKDKKDKKAADKAAQKKEAEENKGKEKAHKSVEKQHKENQKLDRERGTAQREKMAAQVGKDAGSAQAMTKLNAEFEKYLEKEKDLFALLCLQMDDDKARDGAYKQTWLVAPEEIRAIRPPRETAAERLTSAVRKQRTEDNVASSMEQAGALGGMLGKKVERTYELAETEYDKLKEQLPKLPDPLIRQLVDQNIWHKQPPEILEKKPTNEKVDLKAREDARKRLGLRPTPPAEKQAPDSALDPHIDRAGTVASIGGAVDMVGKGPSALLKQAGAGKDKGLNPPSTDGADPVQATVAEKAPLGIGDFAKAVRQTQNRVAKDEAKDKSEVFKNTSDETKASVGIGAVTGIFNGLLSTVTGIFTACKAIGKAHEERTARNVLAATKASADAVKAAASTAKSVANFAKIFDAGVMNSVNAFIPGLNIAISSIGLISQGCDLADAGMRMHDTNNAIFESRVRGMSGSPSGGGQEPDVLIFPLLKVAQAHTKKLEMASWSTGVAVSDLATGIATVASGGGYGIPVAVQAGVKVVDLLHKLGHVIADDVLARISQKSRVDALQSLEGSSEGQMQKDPGMAVDALIVLAKGGDAIALKFVTGFVSPEDLQSKRMGELRGALLATMGTDADPQTMYQSFKSKVKSVKALATGTADKFSDTGAMAKERNALDGKSRGFGWRVKMMFKGEVKFKRSVAKTEAMTGHGLGEVLCAIGSVELPLGGDAQAIDAFLLHAKTVSDAALQKALQDPRNQGQEAQDTLMFIIQDRAAMEASA